jgi:transposase
VLFASTAGGRRERSVPARDLGKLSEEVPAAKYGLGLGPQYRVMSCYNADREGFLARSHLARDGVENLVVDSASIAVPQQARRWKTDRLPLVKY